MKLKLNQLICFYRDFIIKAKTIMAKIYPSYDIIKSLKVPPTSGELKLIDFLLETLDDEYEIFFQPFLNGDCPDVILMRKGGGVLIIEVKDWKLDSYYLDFRKRWFVSYNKALIKSPISQVLQYKENIYNLHIENLLELNLRDYRYWYVVNCAIFFSNEKKVDLFSFLLTPFEEQKIFLKEKCAKEDAFEKLEQTKVLSKRAVNAYKRTNETVLILTYNISLKNYIHDKISNVRDEFHWVNFHIINYHDFFNSVLNNLGIQFDIPENFDDFDSRQKEAFFNDNYYGNLELFEGKKDEIVKYSTILIDEVQDYRTVWLRLLKRYFLKENGEFVVFGDSKQDIYNRVG